MIINILLDTNIGVQVSEASENYVSSTTIKNICSRLFWLALLL